MEVCRPDVRSEHLPGRSPPRPVWIVNLLAFFALLDRGQQLLGQLPTKLAGKDTNDCSAEVGLQELEGSSAPAGDHNVTGQMGDFSNPGATKLRDRPERGQPRKRDYFEAMSTCSESHSDSLDTPSAASVLLDLSQGGGAPSQGGVKQKMGSPQKKMRAAAPAMSPPGQPEFQAFGSPGREGRQRSPLQSRLNQDDYQETEPRPGAEGECSGSGSHKQELLQSSAFKTAPRRRGDEPAHQANSSICTLGQHVPGSDSFQDRSGQARDSAEGAARLGGSSHIHSALGAHSGAVRMNTRAAPDALQASAQPLGNPSGVCPPLFVGRPSAAASPPQPTGAARRLALYFALLKQQEPNAFSGDALQEALKYASSIEVVVDGEPGGAPARHCNMVDLIDNALQEAAKLGTAIETIRVTTLLEGPASTAWAVKAVEQLSDVMPALLTAIEGLTKVELTAAGCLDSIIQQLRLLQQHAQALEAHQKHSLDLTRLAESRRRIAQGLIDAPDEGNELLDLFKHMQSNVEAFLEISAQDSAALRAQEAAYNALAQAGTRTLTPLRAPQGMVCMGVDQDALHHYTLLRAVQNIQKDVKTSLATMDVPEDTTGHSSEDTRKDGYVEQLNDWRTTLANCMNKVVTQAHLPQCLTATTAVREFQVVLQVVPESVRTLMRSAGGNCRRNAPTNKVPAPSLQGSQHRGV